MTKRIIRYADFNHIQEFVSFQEQNDVEIISVLPWSYTPGKMGELGWIEGTTKVFVTYYRNGDVNVKPVPPSSSIKPEYQNF